MARLGHGLPVGRVQAFYIPPVPPIDPYAIPTGAFYVPSPPIDDVWYSSPASSTYLHLAPIASTPLKPNIWAFNSDDQSVQNAAPVDSPIIAYLTKQTMFGKGGQVTLSTWDFYNDDAPVWQSPVPEKSIALQPVVVSKPFVINKWNYSDETAVWNAQSIGLVLVDYLPQTLTVLSSPIPRPADESVWNAAPSFSAFISTSTPSSIIQSGGTFYVPSHPIDYIWNAAPISSTRLHITPAVQNPFVGPQWRHYDDITVWNAQPIDAATLTLPKVPAIVNHWQLALTDDQLWSVTIKSGLSLTTPAIAAPFHAVGWRFNNDDSSTWNTTSRVSAFIQTLVFPKPFTNPVWNYSDDSSSWYSKPNYAAPIPMLTAGGIIKAKQWHYDNDDSSVWWNWTNRYTTSSTIPPKPFVAVNWRFNNDDPPPWQQPSQRSIALPFVPVIIDRWRLDIPDDQPWLLTTQRGIAATYQPKSFIPVVWRFNNDDPPPWQQPSQRSVALPFVPSIVNHWRLELADDQLWSLTAQHNLVFSATPLINRWRLDTIEDQLWSLVANRDLSLTVTPFFTRPYPVTIDDATVWQWSGRQTSLSVVPKIQNRYQANLAQDQLWSVSKYHNLAVTLNIPESFTIRQPSFANDDYACYQWQWRSKNPIILSLKWNIALERIAQTATEKRISKASSEARTIDTALEVRKARTTAEVRTANTPTETRIVKAPDEDK